jgi:glycosyltransferase involved in cell wall biosynthesis
LKQGVLIPVYNHGKTALSMTERLAAMGLPIILVDDGNNEETKGYLAQAAAVSSLVSLVTLPRNCGKGRAVSAGIDRAHELGLTHILQIDADSQHDEGRIPFFLEQARLCPGILICGYPEFDASAPVSRVTGRKIANTWSRIVTLSGDVRDAMCGFRVYPVEAARRILHRNYFDPRMGFDIEILVRLSWEGIPSLYYPVKVIYPKDGFSNFHLVQDNARITWVFTRLFLGMLLRLPVLLYRRRQPLRKRMGGGVDG